MCLSVCVCVRYGAYEISQVKRELEACAEKVDLINLYHKVAEWKARKKADDKKEEEARNKSGGVATGIDSKDYYEVRAGTCLRDRDTVTCHDPCSS